MDPIDEHLQHIQYEPIVTHGRHNIPEPNVLGDDDAAIRFRAAMGRPPNDTERHIITQVGVENLLLDLQESAVEDGM